MINTLSTEDGIRIQTEHLEAFKRILKPEAFEVLHKHATAQNNVAENGYDVLRGTDLDNILDNQVMRFFE